MKTEKTAEETLTEICDLFGIGRDARTHATIITNARNALRRSDILSMIEEHHSTTEKDEDGVEIEECPLRWGEDPDAYLARYVAILGAVCAAPGEFIINAVIRAAAIDRAIVEENGTIYVWAANAPEQIEAALAEAGWSLRQNVKCAATGSERKDHE